MPCSETCPASSGLITAGAQRPSRASTPSRPRVAGRGARGVARPPISFLRNRIMRVSVVVVSVVVPRAGHGPPGLTYYYSAPGSCDKRVRIVLVRRVRSQGDPSVALNNLVEGGRPGEEERPAGGGDGLSRR